MKTFYKQGDSRTLLLSLVLAGCVCVCVCQRVSWSREPPARVSCHSASGCVLTCSLRGAGVTLEWLHAHTGEPVRTLLPLREVFDNGTLVLSRWSAAEFRVDVHAASYRCRARDSSGADLLSRVTTLQPVMAEAWQVRVEAWRGAAGTLLQCLTPPHVATRWLRDARPLTDSDPELSVGGARGQYLVVRAGGVGGVGGAGSVYTCEGTHALSGDTRHSASVDIALLPPILSPEPRIIETAAEESVREGEDVRLVCFAVGDAPITYSWFRVSAGGGLVEAVSSGVRVSVRGELLTVRRARGGGEGEEEGAGGEQTLGTGDAGTWRCRAHNWLAATRRDVTLRVTAPLSVSISPPMQAVAAGGVAEFTCSWRGGAGAARVRWGGGGGPGGHVGGHAGTHGGTRLRLAPMSRAHVGVYQCFVERDDDNAQAVAELRLGECAPELVETFIEQAVHEGARVTLSCRVRGLPVSRVSWLLDMQPIGDTHDAHRWISQVQTATDEVLSVVNMSAAHTELGGRYSCRADNSRGRVEHAARLNVYGPPMVRSGGAVRLVAGDNATLYCPYYGYPISSVEWLPPVNAAGGVVRADGALVLRDVSRGDSGRRTCRVAAPGGGHAARGDLTLHVLQPPKISGFTFPSDLQEGMSVQVLCGITSGDRPIYFSWLKDGDRIPAALQVEEKTMEDFSFLRFALVSARHSGQYTCVASNEATRQEHSAMLLVKAGPAWVTMPGAVVARRGARLHVPCDVTGTPAPDVTWLYGGDGMSEESFTSRLPSGVHTSRAGALVAAAVTRAHAGQYMCRADNRVGKHIQKIITVTVNEPAYFKDSSDSELVSVRRGDTATFTCAPRGDAPLHIHWTHNGRDLDPSLYRIVSAPGVSDASSVSVVSDVSGVAVASVVSMRGVRRHDAGLYSCRAHNRHGAAIRLIYLAVRESPEPPVGLQWSAAGGTLRWSLPASSPRSYSLQLVRVTEGKERGEVRGDVGVEWGAAETRHIAAHTLTILPSGMARLELRDVTPGARYALRLAADNELGRSNYSETILVRIREEAPSGPPLDFQVFANVPGELHLTWQAPPRGTWNGELLGYVYCWRESGSRRVARCSTTRPRDVTGGLAPLSSASHYDVTVRAFNAEGVGPPANTITVAAAPIVPQWAPEQVRCESISTDSIQVWWDVPDELRAIPIVGFDVFYEALEERGLCGRVSARGAARGASVARGGGGGGGSVGGTLAVWVRARGVAGAGPAASALCSTRDDLPGPPADIKLVASSNNSVLVVWLPPFQKNGEILYYNVYTRAESGAVSSQRVWARGELSARVAGRELSARLAGRDVWRDVWVSASSRVGEGPPSTVLTHTHSHHGLSSIASFGGLASVVSGRPVTLRCAVRGEWSVDGRLLPRDGRYTLEEDHLVIHSVDDNTVGNYTCTVRGARGAGGAGEESVLWRVARVGGGAGPRLTLGAVGATRLTLTWAHSGDTLPYVLSYEIEWQWAGEAAWRRALVPAGCVRAGDTLTLVVERGACGRGLRARGRRVGGAGGAGAWGDELSAHTRGGAPKSPTEKDMISTNKTCVRINLLTWDSNGCPVTSFLISYRTFSDSSWTIVTSKVKISFENSNILEQTENLMATQSAELSGTIGGFELEPLSVCNLPMATWHHLKIQATNDAGTTTNTYYFATFTEDGQLAATPSVWPAAEEGGAVGLRGVVGGAGGAMLLAALLYCLWTPLKNGCSSKGYEVGSSEEKIDSKESLRPPSQPVYTSSPIKNGNLKETDACDVYEISPYATFSMTAVAPADHRGLTSAERYKSISLASGADTRSDSESSESMCSECQPYSHRDKGGGSYHLASSLSGSTAAGGLGRGGGRAVGTAGGAGGAAGLESSASSAESRRERTRRRSKRSPASSTPASTRYSRQEQERRDFTIHV